MEFQKLYSERRFKSIDTLIECCGVLENSQSKATGLAAADTERVVAAGDANGEAFEYLGGRIEREKGERKIERVDNDDTSD